MQRHVVKLSERVLGQEHPRTLGRVRALAQTLEMQGKLDEASSLFIGLRKGLGSDNPRTIEWSKNCSSILEKMEGSSISGCY